MMPAAPPTINRDRDPEINSVVDRLYGSWNDSMAHISYLPDDQDVDIRPTETILQASLRAGIPHTHVCGGEARCSTCRVLIVEGLEHCGPRNAREQALATRLGFDAAIRLACQTRNHRASPARRSHSRAKSEKRDTRRSSGNRCTSPGPASPRSSGSWQSRSSSPVRRQHANW